MRTRKGARTLPCDNTAADGLRVKLSSGVVVACGSTDHAIGVVDGNPVNGYCTVISLNTEDGVKMIASGSIAFGALAYAAANGKIAGSGTLAIGVNYTPSAIAGSWCDIQPYPLTVG